MNDTDQAAPPGSPPSQGDGPGAAERRTAPRPGAPPTPPPPVPPPRTSRAFEASTAAVPPAPEHRPHTLTGEFRVHESFHSYILAHDRTIIVSLPPGYDPAGPTRYPVLYLHDGQNLFDQATSFGEEWGVDETAQGLIAAGEIEPLIIAGIYNTGPHRIDEYTPVAVPDQGGGQADLYGRSLVEEIKPFIDRVYRTNPEPRCTGLGGSSLGGLVSMHLGLRHSDVFTRLAVMSPSVWWADRAIVREVGALGGKLPLRIWLDAGTHEGPQVTSDARALRDALVAKGWVVGHDLVFVEAEGAEHNERSWGARVGDVLKYLYPKGSAGC